LRNKECFWVVFFFRAADFRDGFGNEVEHELPVCAKCYCLCALSIIKVIKEPTGWDVGVPWLTIPPTFPQLSVTAREQLVDSFVFIRQMSPLTY